MCLFSDTHKEKKIEKETKPKQGRKENMGMTRELREDETKSDLPSISQALLFTTMSIIGLRAEVHIKDGSVYSGIFHTASLDKGYGIALKKARMIKKGKQNANVPNGGLINTLVVLPQDLVQVVAKDVMLNTDIASSVVAHDEEIVLVTSDSSQGSENGALGSEHMDQKRQVGVHNSQGVENGFCHRSESVKEVHQVHGSNTSLNGCSTELNSHNESHVMVASEPQANGSSPASDTTLNIELMNQFQDGQLSKLSITQSVAPEVSSSIKAEFDASRGSLVVSAETSVPQNRLTNRTVKESKLNPSAKVFSPSFPNFRTPPPLVPTAPSMSCAPNSITAMHIASGQPEVGIRPIMQRSSWPVKFVPYVNPTSTNADNSLQYVPSQITGHIATRAQPVRQGAQYQSVQAVPPYVHTNPQNAMFGRPGQVVYVHPISHDVIQGPTALPQAPPHPLMTSHQIHVPKHEGIFVGQPLQVSMAPPLVANVPQPYAMANHIQQAQPVYSSIHHVPFLGSNVLYGTKFP